MRQTRTSSLEVARPLPPGADSDPGGQVRWSGCEILLRVQVGRTIDESTSVVDGDLTGFGAEHFNSPVACLAHHHCAPETCQCAGHLARRATGGVSFPAASSPIASIFTGRNPGCATERSREARLR
jgi:hypothetical protein